MAAPSYTTDLVDIIVDMANTTGWTLISSGGGGASSLQAPETDYFIQGNNCISRNPFSSSIRGMVYSAGSITIPSGEAVFFWVWAGVPNAIATEANGGIQCLIGSGSAAFKSWYARGSDTYAYGGWVCVPIDPTITEDAIVGTPSGTSFFGVRWNVPSTGPTRGNPFAIDAIRYGRELIVTQGDSGQPSSFIGAASQNDSQSNRWGLLQAIDGGYLQQGLFLMGTATTAVYFRGENQNIAIANTKKVGASFNTFEVRNASSDVQWVNINISALGTTARGNFIVTDNALVSKIGCVFTGMGIFEYLSNSSIEQTTFRRCLKVTLGGGTITNCFFESSEAAAALNIGNSAGNVTDTRFLSSGTGHAIEGFTIAGEYTLTNLNFSGYTQSNGTSGNEAIYVLATTGTVTINISGGNTPSIRSAGATVIVVIPDITLTLTGLQNLSDISIITSGTTTERVNVQENSGSTYAFNYSFLSNDSIDIGIFKAGYIPFYIRGFVLPNGNSNLPIAQVIDRAYLE